MSQHLKISAPTMGRHPLRVSIHRRELLLWIGSAVLTASCDSSSSKLADKVRQQLIGRWLEELSVDGLQTRSIVTLDRDGTFVEMEKSSDASGLISQQTHAGEWSFDGVNFKRKYTSMNGQPLSNARFGYTTYAVKHIAKNEFVGIDNVRKREVRFSQTEAGTP